jgi:hypothetical protein
MFEKVVPINKERHARTRVRLSSDFRFAAQFHLAYLTMAEFVRAGSTYPVVFLEDAANNEFRPVALLGLELGENLFVDAQGQWSAAYIPAIIRRYPFALSKAEDADRYVVCVDEASDLLSETEGSALFDEQGNPTQVIENVKSYLGELQQMDQLTRDFVQYLVQNNLLTPLNLRVNAGDQIKNITGAYVINEERLNNFSDEKFQEIRHKRYLPAIYAHLLSLPQIERLVSLKKPAQARNQDSAAVADQVAGASKDSLH